MGVKREVREEEEWVLCFPFFPILCCGFKVDKLKKLNHNRRFDQMALFGLTVTAKTEQNGFVLKIREGKKKQVLCCVGRKQ